MNAIAVEALDDAVARSRTLHGLLLRYVHVVLVQTAQTAFVNAAYPVETRLARWLLMAHDRLDGGDLPLTHEFLAAMLGVQRTSVTLSVQALEGHGWIRARRGRITVLDRAALERAAGDGYGVSEAEYARLIEGA
jgi:CRP-like cAMP-binding protein